MTLLKRNVWWLKPASTLLCCVLSMHLMWTQNVSIRIRVSDTPSVSAPSLSSGVTSFLGEEWIYRPSQALTLEVDVPTRTLPTSRSNRLLGASMAYSEGWTGEQWTCLRKLWEKESNWRHNAINKTSGAAGIPQAIKIPNDEFLLSPASQIAWGIKYIKARYGTPCKAWQFHLVNNYY